MKQAKIHLMSAFRNCPVILLLFIYWTAQGQNVPKTMLRLPDTGQTGSYTNTFGEDSDYLIHPPFFTVLSDGTATDTVTGLMWQRVDGGEMTVENAQLYCDTLTLAGYTDWRLPTAREAFSILNHQHVNPALDGAVFTPTSAEYWWTSERQANDPNKVWVTNSGGGIGNHPKTETLSAGGSKRFHVRAVRDVTPPPILTAHFADNGDGTTTDLLTGLQWQQIPYPDSLSWEQALQYAENLALAGYDDWRLPNIRELESIALVHVFNPAVDPDFFPGVVIAKYWSATTLPNQQARAWYLDSKFGITTYLAKTARLYFLCVRGQSGVTGINEASMEYEACVLYPNPSAGAVTLQSTLPMERVVVSDALGRIVYDVAPQSQQHELALDEPGTYWVQVVFRNHIVTKKLLLLKS